jgi:hypothetical protein
VLRGDAARVELYPTLTSLSQLQKSRRRCARPRVGPRSASVISGRRDGVQAVPWRTRTYHNRLAGVLSKVTISIASTEPSTKPGRLCQRLCNTLS